MSIHEIIVSHVLNGDIWNSPQGKQIEIIDVLEDRIRYSRGIRHFVLQIQDIENAYKHFRGSRVFTRDLAEFNPYVFSTEHAHRCNAMFFLLLMVHCNLTKDGIHTQHTRGNPSYIYLK